MGLRQGAPMGAMTFEEQIGPVSIALLAVGAWMVGIGYVARSAGVLPNGVRNGVLGALYVGYPIWAIDVGRSLLARARRRNDLGATAR